jgi:riboflavin synthase, alpha subunit
LFTGIVEELGKVRLIRPDRLTVKAAKVLADIELGASIAVNGTCLTVTDFTADSFSVGIQPETLRRTNLGFLKVDDEVNLERAVALGGRLGGHLVQGHIDDTGKIVSIRQEQKSKLMTVAAPHLLMRYMAVKGFVAVDGLSLTIAELGADSFTVSLVEFSQNKTTIGRKKVGDVVNLEVDIIAKYVESLAKHSGEGITFDFLQEHGFVQH